MDNAKVHGFFNVSIVKERGRGLAKESTRKVGLGQFLKSSRCLPRLIHSLCRAREPLKVYKQKYGMLLFIFLKIYLLVIKDIQSKYLIKWFV